jgi:hypothetical protein
MNILTVHNPYAWAIFHAGKDIENRSKRISDRQLGQTFIHAGLSIKSLNVDIPTEKTMPNDFPFGAIVGAVNIVDCVENHSSRWAIAGYWHWVLEDAIVFEKPIFCKGQLGLWKPKEESIMRQLAVYTKKSLMLSAH